MFIAPSARHQPSRRSERLASLSAGVGASALFIGAPAAQAAETAGAVGDGGGMTTLLLASALVLSMGAIALLFAAGEKARAARKRLAAFAMEIGGDTAAIWRPTGVAEIDAVARQMEEMHLRMLEKRSRIAARISF